MKLKKVSYKDSFHEDDINRVYFAKLKIGGNDSIISKFYMHVSLSKIPYIKVVATFSKKIKNILKQYAEFEFSHFVKEDKDTTKESKMSCKMIITKYKFSHSNSTHRQYAYILECYHPMCIMKFRGKNRVFKDKSLSEILNIITSECNIDCVFSFSTKNVKYTLIQLNENNYSFMSRICNCMNISYFCNFADNKVVFGDGETMYSKTQKLPLYYRKLKSMSETMYLNKYSFKYRNKFQQVHEHIENSDNSANFNVNDMDWYCGYVPNFSKSFTNSFISRNSMSILYVIRNLLHFNLMPGTIVDTLVVCDVIISHGFFSRKSSKVRSRIQFANKVSIRVVSYKRTYIPTLFGVIIEKENDVFVEKKDGIYAVKLLPHFEEDENNFLLARVISMFAGNKHGAVFWPRHGTEVMFSFVDLMYSQPIIFGSLFNADNTVLYDDVNMSYWYFNSLGSNDNEKIMNAIMINNKKGKEHIDFSGVKDMSFTSKEILTFKCKNTESTTEEKYVHKCKTISMCASESVELKGKKQTIESDEEYTIKVKDSTITVKKGEVSVCASKIVLQADSEFAVSVAGNELKISNSGVSVTVQSSKISVLGQMVQLESGSKIMINASGVNVM